MQNGEFDLIDKLKKQLGKPKEGVIVGIGDDAAVLQPPTGKMLAAMDIMLEGVHFKRDLISPSQLGAKALAVNISDIAAMGGKPLYALVSLGVTGDCDEEFLLDVYRGMHEMAGRFDVQVVGGDTASSPEGLLVDVCILGTAEKPALRSGAKPGQLLAVTGTLGDSAAGLQYLLNHQDKFQRVFTAAEPSWPDSLSQDVQETIIRHLEPEPQVEAALLLQELGCIGAMQDISDGLASEANHIASGSNVGVVVNVTALPLSYEMRQVAGLLGRDPLDWALNGGEDYQLLFSIDPSRVEEAATLFEKIGVKLTVIGEIREGEGVWAKKGEKLYPLKPEGYNHFGS